MTPRATSLRSCRLSLEERCCSRGCRLYRLGHRAARVTLLTRLCGLSAISFGIGHIVFMPGLLTWIPQWIPPSQMFWAYATTIGFFAAAAATLSGIMAPIASRLLTAEIVGFEILVWIPKLVASPHDHFVWSGNAISVAIAGAVWAVSDSIYRTAKRAPVPAEEAVLGAD